LEQSCIEFKRENIDPVKEPFKNLETAAGKVNSEVVE
jgi:hypothetical protein